MPIGKLVLIGGLDPSLGAGIALDLRIAQSFPTNAYPLITSFALQTDNHFNNLIAVTNDQFQGQWAGALKEPVSAIKMGALGSTKFWQGWIKKIPQIPLVIDPVLQTSTGGNLCREEDHLTTKDIYQEILFPHATVITPNSKEARFFLEEDPTCSIKIFTQKLHEKFGCAVLLTGGHEEKIENILCWNGKTEIIRQKRINKKNIRGTGCAVSTLIAIYLANGKNIPEAVNLALENTYQAIENAQEVSPGVYHLFYS